MQLELAKNAAAHGAEKVLPHVSTAHVIVRSCLNEARESIWNMRSHALEQTDLAGALENAEQQAVRPEGWRCVAFIRRREPAAAEVGETRIERLVRCFKQPMDGKCILPRDHHLAAEPVKGEPLGERLCLRRLAIDQHIPAIRPKDEVVERLALRGEQARPARFVRLERQDVAGQQALQEGPRLFP